ncbi:hypothetical protein STEG23_017373 [Scotinomys teguina]
MRNKPNLGGTEPVSSEEDSSVDIKHLPDTKSPKPEDLSEVVDHNMVAEQQRTLESPDSMKRMAVEVGSTTAEPGLLAPMEMDVVFLKFLTQSFPVM